MTDLLSAYNQSGKELSHDLPFNFVQNREQSAVLFSDKNNSDGSLVLKPIISCAEKSALDEFNAASLDEKSMADIEKICKRISELPQESHEQALKDSLTYLLAFMMTRGGVLKLITTDQSARGYGYACPLDLPTLLAMLTQLSQMGLVKGIAKNAAYCCPECESINVLIRESCPKCHSVHVTDEPLLHHFTCSYQAPESDFRSPTGEYFCPKCNKEVLHIGLDYDKPGEVTVCHDCDNFFTSEDIAAYCTHCDKEFPLEKMRKQFLYDYRITEEGVNALISNSVAQHDPAEFLGEDLNLVGIKRFQFVKSYMSKLAKRYEFESSVVFISLEEDKIQGHETESTMLALMTLGKELSVIMRDTDLVCYYDRVIYLFLPYTSVEDSKIVYTRLYENIKKSLAEDVAAAISIQIKSAISEGESSVSK